MARVPIASEIEVLDVRHFSARQLRRCWSARLTHGAIVCAGTTAAPPSCYCNIWNRAF